MGIVWVERGGEERERMRGSWMDNETRTDSLGRRKREEEKKRRKKERKKEGRGRRKEGERREREGQRGAAITSRVGGLEIDQ